jgi:tetratricopeptide (TPR) repeat protein
MEDLSYVESLFIKADTAITGNNIAEGKEILEELLEQFPDYGRAHNHLGWIYSSKYSNYEKAEYHFKLAIKYEPTYPASYLNYAYLLVDTEKYNEAKELINKTLVNIKGIDKGSFYSELGRIYEMERNYLASYKFYKKAIQEGFNPKFIENMNSNLKRLKGKMTIFDKLKILFTS